MANETEIKSKKRKKWFWIAGGILLLIIIIAIATGGEKEGTTSGQQSLQEQTQPTQNSQLGEQAEPEPEPEPIWHTVINFSGLSNKSTQPFSIAGNQWRVKWNFQETDNIGGIGKGVFGASIYRIENSTYTEQIYHSRSSANDVSYIYEGKGDFYIKITVANTKGWSITVEDLY